MSAAEVHELHRWASTGSPANRRHAPRDVWPRLGEIVDNLLAELGDAPDVWDGTWPPGGYVCSTCGTPVESEPCPDHQPAAYAEVNS